VAIRGYNRKRARLRDEKQPAPAEYYHGNQDAEHARKDGQQHQLLIRFQDCETLPNKFPGLSDSSDGVLLLGGHDCGM
jgi:hypothetical protein